MIKKNYLFTLFLPAFLWLGTGTIWGETLTIGRKTNTSIYFPVYGNYADWYQHVQIIYPKDSLTALVGQNITGMTFYLKSSASGSWGAATFRIGLTTTKDTADFGSSTYHKYVMDVATTQVYSGALDGTGSTMVVTFDTPFTYTGGNLFYDLQSLTKGTYKDATFYGATLDQDNYNGFEVHNSSSLASADAAYVNNGVKFIPKTTFTYEAAGGEACPKPGSLTATTASSTSATITWKKKGSESAWDLQYSDDDFATNTELNLTTSDVTVNEDDCSYILTGLTAATDYKVQVRANCGGDDGESSYTAPVSFRTYNGVPFADDFESQTANAVPAYWDNSASTSTTASQADKPAIWNVYQYSGNKMIRMYNYWAQSGVALINTPTIELPAAPTECELTFEYAHNASCGAYYVKISTNGGSSFTNLNSYTKGSGSDKDNPGSFTEATIDLAEYAGEKIILQFDASANYGNGSIFVDNVSVHAKSSCAKPSGLAYTNESITSSGATFTWSAGGSESKWNLQYKGTGDADWTLVEDVTSPYVLSDARANTDYSVQVQADCGGSQSEWTSSASFRTACAPIDSEELPWTYGFEDGLPSGDYVVPYCWQRKPNDNNVYVQTTNVYAGSKSLKVYGGTSYSGANTIILPEFEEDIANLTIQFYYKTTSVGASYGKPVIGYVNTSGTFVALKSDLAQSASDTYAFAEYTYPSSYEDTPANLAIQYTGGTFAYGSGSMYIDAVTVKRSPTCFKPTALNCDSKTSTTATISWTAGKVGDDAWVVEYSTASNFATSTEAAATSNSYTISGLTAQTTYYVRVKTDCGSSDYSDYCEAINITTACAAQALPLEEDFSGAISCWSKVDCHSETGVSSGAFKFRYSTTPPQYLISPELVASAKALQVAFDYKAASSMFEESFVVGYSTTTNAISAFTWGTEQTELTNTSYTNYSENLPAGVKYVAIKYTANDKSALFIDNFSVSVAPTCFKPATLNNAASITPEGATFIWTASSSNNEDYYQYICVAGGTDVNDIDWSASTKVAKAVAPATNQAVLTGKAAGTYDFYVRSWCSNDDQSEAVKKSFTTATVTAPTIGAITTTNETAHATWTAPNVSFDVQYQWKTSNEGSDWSDATSNLYADISDLDASTTYTFYVRSYYDASHIGSDVSTTFKTACDPFTVAVGTPFEQNFNDVTTNAIPDCWNNDEGTTTTASYKWKVVTGGQSGKCAMFNGTDNGSGKTNVLATPLIELNSDADLSFYWKNKKTGAYAVEISVDGAARTTLVSELTGIDAWTLVDKPLTSYNGHTIQLFFCGTSINDGSANLYLDELKITPISCRKPASDPVASAISDTEATLTWTAGGTNTDYQFALALKDEAPVWKTANVVNALTKSFDDLTPMTNYDFYVRTYCDALNQSEARKVSFRTECADFVTMPFEESFNSVAANAIPECWDNREGTSSDTYKWKAVTYSGRNSSNCVRFNSSTNDADATNVLATPTIQLNEGNLLSFWAKNPTGGALKVQIKEEGEDAVDLIATGLTDLADWTFKYVDIPAAYNNKKVQILFHATSNAGDEYAYIYIDDVRVLKHLSLSDADNNATVLNNNNGKKVAVTIGRTIVRKGYYNTICLPFSLSAEELAASPIASDDLWAFKYAKVDEATDELLFRIDRSDHIEAGVPYFIGFENNEDDIVNPFFNNVTISATVGQNVGNEEVAQLCGIVDQPVVFTAHDQTKLFLAANNTFYWWNGDSDSQMNAFRAYFKVNTTTSGPSYVPRHGMRARIIKEEQVATGIEDVQGTTVQSTKLLENSQVVIIRNGVKYNLQGQVIK